MKRVGITQRVTYVENISERRDCLDQRWPAYILKLGYIPIPLSNLLPGQVSLLLDELNLDAVILSGGNSISICNHSADDSAPERDAFEIELLEESFNRDIAILGVCRGMQMINIWLGGRLKRLNGHVGVRHSLYLAESDYQLPKSVNSYHNWGISSEALGDGLKPIAFDDEGNIEAYQHLKKRLVGVMWHPEREKPYSQLDMQLVEKFLS